MKKISFALLALALSYAGMAQNYWAAHTGDLSKIATDKAVARQSFPKEFKLFNLNDASLRQQLFTVVDGAARHTTIIAIPNAYGQMEEFSIVEASNFEPALQAQFPQIRAFSGRGITDPSAMLKLS